MKRITLCNDARRPQKTVDRHVSHVDRNLTISSSVAARIRNAVAVYHCKSRALNQCIFSELISQIIRDVDLVLSFWHSKRSCSIRTQRDERGAAVLFPIYLIRRNPIVYSAAHSATCVVYRICHCYRR